MRRLSRGRLAALTSYRPCARHGGHDGLRVLMRPICPFGSRRRSAAPAASARCASSRRSSGRPSATLDPVRFYVDGTLFKTDDDGPPYAVEWTDENPFERRELAVEVDDSEGHKGATRSSSRRSRLRKSRKWRASCSKQAFTTRRASSSAA